MKTHRPESSAPAHAALVAPGVYHFATHPFNWYVIEEGGRLTLLDAGWPGHLPTFTAGLASIGKSLDDVEAIVLTHAHMDHVGMAGPLARAAGIPIFIHADDRAMAASVLQLPWYGLFSNAWRPFTAVSMLGHAIRNGLLAERPLRDTIAVHDGQHLDVPGQPVVVHVPGHSPGEIAVWLPNRSVLFSGDTLVTEDLRTGIPGPPQFPHVTLNGDDRRARRSIDAIAALGRVTMLPGHGKPWHGEAADAVEIARTDRAGRRVPEPPSV